MSPARPYRAFLTAALHRRFVEAAGAITLFCWLIQIWLNGLTSIWSYIPLGPAGFRSLAILLCMLMVLIIRISNLRASRYNFDSHAHKIVYVLSQVDTCLTLICYIGSAALYAEIYIWMQPAINNFSTIDPGRLHERARLNERPILLRCLYLVLAFGQFMWHFHLDANRIQVPIEKKTKPGDPPKAVISQVFTGNSWRNSRTIMEKSIFFAIFTVPVGIVLYWETGMRQLAWSLALSFALVITPSAFNPKPNAIPPFVGDILSHFVVGAICLHFLWEVTNNSFTLAVARAPLKSKTGETLSQQPDLAKSNATLVSGLRSKRDLVKTNAFWELRLVSNYIPQRRVAIFKDINQIEGSIWSQIFTIALAELHAIVFRIQDVSGVKAASGAFSPTANTNDALMVPRQLPGLKTDPEIFQNPAPPKTGYSYAGREFANFAKSIGNSPGAVNPISPRAKKLIEHGANNILTPEQKAQLNSGSLVSWAKGFVKPFLASPVGVIFRCTYARRVSRVVLGGPLANASVVVDAIDSLTQLALYSTTEDPYGLVFKDVATLIRTYSSTLEKIQEFITRLGPHWTDPSDDRKLSKDGNSDVELVVAALRKGLQKLVNEFGDHVDELGISRGELRKAKAACSFDEPGRA